MAGEWSMTTLADGPLQIIDGDRGTNYPKQGEFGSSGRCLFLNAGNVTINGFNFSDCAFISAEKDAALRKGKLRRHDIVLTTRGTVGNVAYFDDSIRYDDIRINSGMVILRAREQELRPRFLYLFMRSSLFQTQVESLRTGSAQPQLPVRDINRVELPVPPLNEQDAIAHILGTLDDKIELNGRMNETLEAMARALFKSWFVDFDPVRAKAEGRDPGLPKHLADLFPDSFQESELGEIPSGWCASPVYDLATYINGAAYRAFEPNEQRRGLPIIKIAELKAGVTAQTRFSDVEMPEKYRIDNGDVLFSWSGNPDTSIDIFVWNQGPAWLNQHIFRVVPNNGHEREFVLMALRTLLPVFAEIARNKQTTGLGHVTVEDLQRLLAVRPPKSVLLGWNTLVEPLLARSFGLEGQNNTLTALRDTLLPKLISGEVVLHDVGRLAGEIA